MIRASVTRLPTPRSWRAPRPHARGAGRRHPRHGVRPRPARPRLRRCRRRRRVSTQPARVVARNVEALVALDGLVPVRLEANRAETLGSAPATGARPARRFSTPRFHRHRLADVAAVHARAEARRSTAPGSARAPASSTRGSASSRARPARRMRRWGTRRCRACRTRSRRLAAPTPRSGRRRERAEDDPQAVPA